MLLRPKVYTATRKMTRDSILAALNDPNRAWVVLIIGVVLIYRECACSGHVSFQGSWERWQLHWQSTRWFRSHSTPGRYLRF